MMFQRNTLEVSNKSHQKVWGYSKPFYSKNHKKIEKGKKNIYKKEKCTSPPFSLEGVLGLCMPRVQDYPRNKFSNRNISILTVLGGFQLLDLIIPRLKSHMIPYKFKSSHWLKLQHSYWRANLVKDIFLQINFPLMRALEFIRDHGTFKLWYNQI